MTKRVIPQKGEIWKVDYSYKFQPADIPDSSFEVESLIKKPRPSLIISDRIKNENDLEAYVIPFTSIELDQLEPFEIAIFPNTTNGLTKPSKILVDMIMPVNQQYRLKEKIGQIDAQTMREIEATIKLLFAIDW